MNKTPSSTSIYLTQMRHRKGPHQSLPATDSMSHERAKKNKYEERVLEVEKASFTPLVFNTSGGASPLTTTFIKHLASLLAEKSDHEYSTVLCWLRARLNFSLLRSSITCVRGSRSTRGHARWDNNPELAVNETRLSSDYTISLINTIKIYYYSIIFTIKSYYYVLYNVI